MPDEARYVDIGDLGVQSLPSKEELSDLSPTSTESADSAYQGSPRVSEAVQLLRLLDSQK